MSLKCSVQYLLMLVVCVSVVAKSKRIDESALNVSEEDDCDSAPLKQKCQQICGENHACFMGRCFCLQSAAKRTYVQNIVNSHREEQDVNFSDFDDYTEMTPTLHPRSVKNKPALRHHIAHFCPNLEEARKCIRSCMAVGKPAFCGKDHTCYCGHRNGTPGEEKEVNVTQMYSQFQDLYEKYFGPKYSQDCDEEHHDIE